MRDILDILAKEFDLDEGQIEKTINLIDEGNTIPFIARYRKEVTGGLSDTVLRDLDERLKYLRNLEDRKNEVLRLIEEQGKLTDELKKEIEDADVLQRVEDLYKPYKKKKATRASKARERGLEPLADRIKTQSCEDSNLEDIALSFVDPEKDVVTWEDAVQGACDIIAEEISEDADLIEKLRGMTYETGVLCTEATNPEEKSVYDMYYDRSERVKEIPNHRILAINRGEKEKKLKVKIQMDEEQVEFEIGKSYINDNANIYTDLMKSIIKDSYKRLISPSLERETRNVLTERAELDAVKVFAKNTENLLMAAPVRGKK